MSDNHFRRQLSATTAATPAAATQVNEELHTSSRLNVAVTTATMPGTAATATKSSEQQQQHPGQQQQQQRPQQLAAS